MSIFDWLGLGQGAGSRSAEIESSAVREIVERLEVLCPERARWVASFAMILARTARADFLISPDELVTMQRVLVKHGGLDPEQSALVVEMATHREELLGASEAYLATREFRKVAAEGDRERLLHCLFAVTSADQSISLVEEEEIRQIANELGVEHVDFNRIRSQFREHRSVLKVSPEA
jgi:uncharacterized tellurite resistance protein B-like protein